MPEDSLSKCNSNRWATEDSYANLYKNFDRRPRVEIGFFGLPGLKKSTIACHMKRFPHVPTICRLTWLTWRTPPTIACHIAIAFQRPEDIQVLSQVLSP